MYPEELLERINDQAAVCTTKVAKARAVLPGLQDPMQRAVIEPMAEAVEAQGDLIMLLTEAVSGTLDISSA